jgi:ABC-type Mn2+/Zn2+ transport system ATPase subunit
MDGNLKTKDQKLTTILQVQNLTVYYDAVLALENISLTVNEGEIVAMIGPNGAGKSTLNPLLNYFVPVPHDPR